MTAQLTGPQHPDRGRSDYPQISGGHARPVHWRGLISLSAKVPDDRTG